jgi:hypothetical protein
MSTRTTPFPAFTHMPHPSHLTMKVVVSLLVAANAFVWSLGMPADSRADHAFQGGNCWQTGVARQCAAGYVQDNAYFYRVHTAWSGTIYASEGTAALDAARTSWSNVSGPQRFVTSSSSSTPYMNVYTWMYPTYTSGDYYIDYFLASSVAVTSNWEWNGAQYSMCYSNACVISFSEVYVNTNVRAACGSWSAFSWQYLFAHEFGHSQGLDDHGSGNILMNNAWSFGNYPCYPDTSANGPTATEVGTAVPWGATTCSSPPSPKGIRCIFKWPY